ncbi:MAG: hypothetical protein V1886_00930 [archaeon]
MAKKHEKTMHEHEKKPRKINPWVVSTVALAVIALIFISLQIFSGSTINSKAAGEKVLKLVNDNFVQDSSATLDSISIESGLYKVTLNYNSNKIPVYLTKDAKFLILPSGIISVSDLETPAEAAAETEIPKSDKPVVELFVMSFCPYGVNAENNILPVAELLKNKIDFKVKFISTVNGNTINDVSSLHGINEAKEDARQAVIMKYYPAKYYAYLEEFNNNCYSVASNAAKLDACWKNATTKLGMNISKIEAAAYGAEGTSLLKQDEADAAEHSVSGSPTLLINGVKSDSIYSGTEAAQAAICSAFSTEPSECSVTVTASVTGAAASNGDTPQCG